MSEFSVCIFAVIIVMCCRQKAECYQCCIGERVFLWQSAKTNSY